MIWSGPPTLKDKGLNRACTPGDEDLGALLGVRLHTFPYYPTEQITSLKFLNFPGGLSPSPPCKQTLDCILLLITLELLQDQSFQLPEPERCLFFFFWQLFAPWLIAGETRNLKDAGIFCSFFPLVLDITMHVFFIGMLILRKAMTFLKASGEPPEIPRHSISLGRLSVQSCTLETLSLGVSR